MRDPLSQVKSRQGKASQYQFCCVRAAAPHTGERVGKLLVMEGPHRPAAGPSEVGGDRGSGRFGFGRSRASRLSPPRGRVRALVGRHIRNFCMGFQPLGVSEALGG